MNFLKRLWQRVASYDDGTLPQNVARNLRFMILSVLVAQICFNATGGSAFTGYIKALGATDFILGVLMALPFCVRVMQIFASYILERTGKRKALFCTLGLISRLLWIPIALVPLFVPMEPAQLRVWTILLLYTLVAVTGTFIDSGFFSLAADVVPMRIRGRYFSVRSKVSMVFSIAAGLIVSFMLDNITGYGGLLGYMIVFVLAGITGAGDIFCFIFMKFPPMDTGEEDGKKRESLASMVGGVLRNKPFMKLVLFWTVWSLSVNIMAPYFNVYMLEHLGMSFMQITLLATIPANVCSFLFVQRWGGMMDGYGYRAVLYICATVGSLLPLLWLFSAPGLLVPVLIAQMLSGAFWPAIDLSSQNTIMNAAPVRNRSMYATVHAVVTQLCGVAVAYVLGGFLLDNVFTPLADTINASGFQWFGHSVTQYHFMMVVTTVLRLLAVFLFLPVANLESEKGTLAVIREVAGNLRKSAARNLLMLRGQILRRRFRRREEKERENGEPPSA